jgi:GNAT superfamily N-acetyltransferase
MPDQRDRLSVNIHPARETDTPGVMELSSRIWDGEDYVPHVWFDWLSDPRGMLVVAEHQNKIIGLGKLTCLSEKDWWLEGLRVHPDFEGRGIASQIHEFLLDAWTKKGRGTVRLGTASHNLPVQHLCDRLGFRKIVELSIFVAPTFLDPVHDSDKIVQVHTSTDNSANVAPDRKISSPDHSSPIVFKPVAFEEVTEATIFALQSESLALSSGLIDLGWQWAPPREEYLARIIERCRAWWWQERRGLLAIDEQKGSGQEPTAIIVLLACSLEDVGELLSDYRRLAASLGFRRAAWMTPLDPGLLPVLQTVGFEREWDASMFIYSRL